MYKLLIIGFLSILLFSCEKPVEYSPVPQITFSELSLLDTVEAELDNPIKRVKVQFDFIDGDGDLGLSKADTFGDFGPGKKYYYNLTFSVFEKKNDKWILNEKTKPYFRFQNISKQSTSNKVLKGYMSVDVDFLKNIGFTDTIRLDFFIYDRALHKSNVASTPEIYLYE